MKLAYMIQAHKDFEQLTKLMDTLLDEDTDLFLHVDKKNEHLYSEINQRYEGIQNVHVISNRENVNWSGFSQVVATLKLMAAVKNSKTSYDYVSLISGQYFPIKSNVQIKSFLSENYGKEFLEYRDIEDLYWRLKCYNFFRENKNNRKLSMRILDNLIRYPQKLMVRRKNFTGLNLYFGSSWFTITYNCMLYILNYLEENPEFLLQFYYSACPDEHFFQIIIMNSRYRKNVANDNLRYIDWSSGKNSPEILTIKDFDKLKSSPKLFARKFDFQKDKKVVNEIYEFIS